MNTSTKKILIFGAGRIGRSFIANIFYAAGFKIVFVDIDQNLTDLLNLHKTYNIIIKEEKEKIIPVMNIKAVHIENLDTIKQEIVRADICAVSVGKVGLKKVMETIGKTVTSRYEKYPNDPLDIILAENLRNAADRCKKFIKPHLPDGFPIKSYLGFIETSIGKMVPFMTQKDTDSDPLQVFAERYNTLILDEKAFLNPVPEIEGLSPKKNMKAWVDRKLFIHNLGHASLAYLGYLKNPEWKYTYEALADQELKKTVYKTMQESAYILLHMHSDEFTQMELTNHINDLIGRFSNHSLKDTIFRVGCDLERKLGPEDRLIPIIKYGYKNELPIKNIMKVLVAGIYFDARDENNETHPSDLKFLQKFNRNLSRILVHHCKFDPSRENDLIFLAMNLNDQLNLNLKT